MLDGRAIAPLLARVVLVFVVGALPWPGLRVLFARGYAHVANSALSRASYGRGGRVLLEARPIEAPRAPQEHVSWDAALVLSAEHPGIEHRLGVNLRRDAYLPVLVLLGVLMAAPMGIRRRFRAVLLGSLVLFATSLAGLHLLAHYVYATALPHVHPVGDLTLTGLDVAVQVLLQPPGNRFLLAFALGAWFVAGVPSASTKCHEASRAVG